CALWYSNHFIF
nr:immunoglobulin light chain junction region [Mus musculus]NSM03195.1 immunoglobulin light chain junction region [Mus musculus]NSM03221.1 immunoglobulin light chain junction region [Mus musculus]NSM03255.1 immunoglobulin light chain junction region [Mus musculus]NSM03324.1 immunoglobulin light chain junction region [Mus musculus]